MRHVVRRSLLSLIGMAGLIAPVSAQDAAVRGRVTSLDTGQPLPEVFVGVEGSATGTLTSRDGTFLLSGLSPGPTTLVISRIGFKPETRTLQLVAGDTATVAVQLETTRIQMEDLVASVEAAGVQRKEIGTDIAEVDVESELEVAAAGSFSELLNARAENVTIQLSSGLTGMGSRVRIRGSNSITQDNNPLIVIDGVRISNDTDLAAIGTGGQSTSRLEDLDPSEIARIQVIKGPTAATLYGSEAAAGVLVIETKQGQTGTRRSRFTFETTQGFVSDNNDYPDTYGEVTRAYGVTDLGDPRIAGFRAVQNPVSGQVFVLDNPFMDSDTRPFREGHQQSYAGTIRGGSGDFGYYGSLRWQNQGGSLDPNELRRVNARANFNVVSSNLLQVSFNSAFIRSNLSFPDDNSTALGYGVGGYLGFPVFAFGSDGRCLLDALTGDTTGACDGRNGLFRATFDELQAQKQSERLTRFLGSASATITPTSWLTGTATVGIDEADTQVLELFRFDPEMPLGGVQQGQVTDSRQRDRTATVDLGATAALDVSEEVRSTSSIGVQYFGKRTEVTTCQGEVFPSDQVSSCDAALIVTGNSSVIENVELGAFFQQRFGFRDYLFLSGGLRVDDNSALGSDEGVIWSPSANLSAVISDMPFWNVSFVDELRLRFAWGLASQSPAQFQGDQTFANAPVTIGGQQVSGITPLDPGNPNLGPERTEEFEAGFDADLLNRRVGVTFTYFNSTTTDAIIPSPVAPSTGFPGERFVNLGSLSNEGIEVGVDARVLSGEHATLDLRLTASTSDPIVDDLGRDQPIIFPVGADGGSRAAGSQVFQTGLPPGAYISEVVGSATRNADGNITEFELLPGNIGDGTNRRYVGNPNVTNEQALAATLTLFDHLRVFTLFDRRGGNDLLNVTRAFRTPFIDNPTASSSSRDWAFRQAEASPEVQAMYEQRILAPFVEDGSFVKWRELTVSYDLPAGVASRFGAEQASITVGGRNLRTFTDFSGIDPEGNVRGSRDDFIRNNFAGIGIPQTYFATVRVTF